MTQTSSQLETKRKYSSEPSEAAVPSRLQYFLLYISSNWVLCVVFFGIALAFDLYRLGNPSIWFDEAFSVELARQPLPLLWHIIFGLEPNMELYYLFLHGWLGFTGLLGLHDTEFVVRFPSTIFAALSTVMVFLLGRRYLGLTAAMVGASLYLLNDLQLVYAQQTRAYSLQLLFICIAWYAFLAVLTSGTHSKRWWGCFIVATTLAIYTHLFSFIILFAQLFAFGGFLILPGLRRNSLRRQIPAFLISLVSIGVLVIPMIIVSRNGSKTGWLSIPHLHDIYHLFLTISGQSKIYLFMIVACGALAVLVSLLANLPSGKYLLDRLGLNDGTDNKLRFASSLPLAFALICWLLVPVVVSYIISQGPTRLFSSRYLVTIVPPLCLLVGMGVATLRWRKVQVVLALGLIVLALYVVPLYYKSAQVEDWNSTSHWLQQHYQAGDGMVCYNNDVEQGCQIAMEYYLHAYPGPAHFTSDSPGAFSWANFGPVNPAVGSKAAVDPKALAAYGAKHPRIFFIVGRLANDADAARVQAAQNWLDTHYQFISQIVTRTVTIRLYATNIIRNG